jgi:hypothetical protein
MRDDEQGELNSEQLAEIGKDAVMRHCALLFEANVEYFDEVRAALKQLPFAIAAPALARIDEIQNAIGDALGEYAGQCFLCESAMFITGKPDENIESAGDEQVHRTCADKWRKENPGERDYVRDDGP